ncbi:MAG: hypothetical protein E7624_04815 [Ruminococcaceae bacterium]|nr:hypothetical protein [Oscillospiraceae bacterium]
MKIIKALALTLALLFTLSAFISCDADVVSMVADADEALKETPYTVTVDTAVTCENETVSKLFDALDTTELSIAVDGDNMALHIDSKLYTADMKTDYLLLDDAIYMSSTIFMEEDNSTLKIKAPITAAQREKFFTQTNAAGKISSLDFQTVVSAKEDGTQVITCTDLKSDSIQKVKDVLGATLQQIGVTIEVENAKFVIEIKDGKYQKTSFSCSYKLTTSGTTFAADIVVDMAYDYDTPVKVEVPADAADYDEVDFDELLNS